MKKILFSVLSIFLLLLLLHSYSFSETEKGRSESLDLSVDEASTLLKELDPNIKILGVSKSPVEGLWEVAVEAGNRKSIVYIDSSKKYLLSGALISIKGKKNLTQERLTELSKVDVSQIPLDDAIVMGDKDAKYRVIVFDDPE
ncbi:MAG TPA: disulfide isomerase DsbC N-terminal domain-containing protein [Thermodesulfovibrionales bacterium]|nr:disulfide isomerase DsbC N-terminal domain-containing protein [Thermodesulfovibrionales bacterium]